MPNGFNISSYIKPLPLSPLLSKEPLSLPPSFSSIDHSLVREEGVELPQVDENQAYLPELGSRHNQLARLIALGFSSREAAERLNMSQSNVRIISRSPLFLTVVAELREELDKGVAKAQSILAEGMVGAAEQLVAISKNSENERLRKEAASEVLDKGGLRSNQPSSPTLSINISDSKIDLIFNTLKELR